jgi:hypothetical protein
VAFARALSSRKVAELRRDRDEIIAQPDENLGEELSRRFASQSSNINEAHARRVRVARAVRVERGDLFGDE